VTIAAPSLALRGAPDRDRLGRIVGAILLVQLTVTAAVKIATGAAADLLWVSHVALALSAAGFLLRRPMLLAVALTMIAVPHAAWIVDSVVTGAGGRSPLGLTRHLMGADALAWLASAHHVYLLPLLLVAVRRRGYPRGALATAIALVVALSLLARLALPAPSNVNYAHRLLPGIDHPLSWWMNGLPPLAYLSLLNGAIAAGVLVPTAVLLRRWTRPG
jgi:hypothetical protein